MPYVLPVLVRGQDLNQVAVALMRGRRTGKKMADKFLVGEVATLFMAGFETTGVPTLLCSQCGLAFALIRRRGHGICSAVEDYSVEAWAHAIGSVVCKYLDWLITIIPCICVPCLASLLCFCDAVQPCCSVACSFSLCAVANSSAPGTILVKLWAFHRRPHRCLGGLLRQPGAQGGGADRGGAALAGPAGHAGAAGAAAHPVGGRGQADLPQQRDQGAGSRCKCGCSLQVCQLACIGHLPHSSSAVAMKAVQLFRTGGRGCRQKACNGIVAAQGMQRCFTPGVKPCADARQ